MKLNTLERLIVTNPVRHFIQQYWEVPRLLRLGPVLPQNPQIIEIGCGSGNGAKALQKKLNPKKLTTIDLDERMVLLAQKRLKGLENVRALQANASDIPQETKSHDAIFDMGVLHHIPYWRGALWEIHRVLKDGGVLYAEEFYKPLICNSVIRKLIKHPQKDRFTHNELLNELKNAGFKIHFQSTFFGLSGTVIAIKEASG